MTTVSEYPILANLAVLLKMEYSPELTDPREVQKAINALGVPDQYKIHFDDAEVALAKVTSIDDVSTFYDALHSGKATIEDDTESCLAFAAGLDASKDDDIGPVETLPTDK
jgi:hypothetical protein